MDEAIGHVDDLLASLPPKSDDADKFKAAREAWVGGKAKTHLGYLEKLLSANTEGGFLLGSKMSIFDLLLVGTVGLVEQGWLDHVPKDMFVGYPAIYKAFTEAKANPLVAEQLAPPS